MTPLVSVVIPSYNHRGFIGEAIASVRAQTHEPLELVVVDDGSTDGSFETVRDEWAQAVDRLARHDNRGAHATLNEAIALSKGEWIAILNSDDVYDAGRVAKLLAFATREGHDLVFSDVGFCDESGPLPADHKAVQSHARAVAAARRTSVEQALLRGNVSLTTSNLMVRRAAYETIGPFRAFRYCHDWDFLLRAVGRVRIGWLAEPLLRYRLHAANTIREVDPWRHLTEKALVYAAFLAEAPEAAAAWQSDYLFEARELPPLALCWLLSEGRRTGFAAVFEELERGTLHERLRLAFEPHCDARDAGLSLRDINRRLGRGSLKGSLYRLRDQLMRAG